MRRHFAMPAAALAALTVMPKSLAAADGPIEVSAVYSVKFNGLNIGDFRFKSKAGAENYKLEGDSKLSIVFGAFKWKGSFKTTGGIEGGRPKPASYSFVYDSGKKRGSVKIAFEGDRVSKVALDPAKTPSRLAVPIQDEHLADVFDPLSAIMAMTRYDGGNPCQGKLPVFDGLRRFDLALSPNGKRGSAYVCRLRYLPIAGHKPNEENQSLSEGNIEIVLKPAPEAKLVLPTRITIPTAYGKAVLTSKRVVVGR